MYLDVLNEFNLIEKHMSEHRKMLRLIENFERTLHVLSYVKRPRVWEWNSHVDIFGQTRS